MRVLFVNIGPAYKNWYGRVSTDHKFWFFFRELCKYAEIEYIGPVKEVEAEKSGAFEVEVKHTELPYFSSTRDFIFKSLNPVFLIKILKSISSLDWGLFDCVYLRDVHPLTIIVFVFSIFKDKLSVLHIAGGGSSLARANFSGLKKFIYLCYAYILDLISWIIAKRSIVLLSTRHPYIRVDNIKKFHIDTTLLSEKERVDEKFVKEKYGKRDIDRSLLFVGRLSVEKGVDILIKAFEEIREKFHNIRLIIVGDGPEREKLQSMAKSLISGGVCKFVGQLCPKDVFKYMRDAYLLVMPSRSEGLPKVLVEALNCGVGIVATTVGRIPEFMKGGGCLLVPPEDKEALARGIETLLNDPSAVCKLALESLAIGKQHTLESEIDGIYRIISTCLACQQK